MSFYKKSAGVLHDVLKFLQDVPKRGFWRVDGGKMVGKWKWRLDKDVKGSRTW